MFAENCATHLKVTCKHTAAKSLRLLIVFIRNFFSPVIRQFQQIIDSLMFWQERKPIFILAQH